MTPDCTLYVGRPTGNKKARNLYPGPHSADKWLASTRPAVAKCTQLVSHFVWTSHSRLLVDVLGTSAQYSNDAICRAEYRHNDDDGERANPGKDYSRPSLHANQRKGTTMLKWFNAAVIGVALILGTEHRGR